MNASMADDRDLAEENRLIDLLADGELDEPRRRELLLKLDQRPDGWRRCALALLESLEWRRAMPVAVERGYETIEVHATDTKAAVAAAAAAATSGDTTVSPRTNYTPGWRGTLLAMAASFAVAFFGAWWGFSPPGASTVSSPGGFAGPAIPSGTGPGVAGPGVAGAGGPRGAVAVPGEQGLPEGAVQYVRIQAGDQEMLVPFVSADKARSTWMANIPAAMPQDVVEEFRRYGHQVQTHREFVPIELEDGRCLVMPVDQVQVRYVGFQ